MRHDKLTIKTHYNILVVLEYLTKDYTIKNERPFKYYSDLLIKNGIVKYKDCLYIYDPNQLLG